MPDPQERKSVDVKAVLDYIYSEDNKKRLREDYQRYVMYNGQIKKYVEKAIRKEFKLPETVDAMLHRIVPINIIEKIISKLAQIYKIPPVRASVFEDEKNAEAITFYSTLMMVNQKFKNANKYVELYKHSALEPFLNDKNVPSLRALPSYQYTPISTSSIDPTNPNIFVKHIYFDPDDADAKKKEHKHYIWTDEELHIVDGNGAYYKDSPQDYKNPYEVIPFTYINTSDDRVVPIPDDDLITMQIQICLLLTDLNLASKYKSWNLIYVVNAEQDNIPFNANSIVSLKSNNPDIEAKVGTIEPSLDTDGLIKQVETLLAFLMSTKNLSTSGIKLTLDAGNPAPGISKMLDMAELVEDRDDQKSLWIIAEADFWDKFANHILPVWIKDFKIDEQFIESFTADFGVNVQFQELKPKISEKEVVEVEKLKLDAKLTTLERSLKKLYPDMNDKQIKDLLKEIQDEVAAKNPFKTGEEPNGANGKQATGNDADPEDENAADKGKQKKAGGSEQETA